MAGDYETKSTSSLQFKNNLAKEEKKTLKIFREELELNCVY